MRNVLWEMSAKRSIRIANENILINTTVVMFDVVAWLSTQKPSDSKSHNS